MALPLTPTRETILVVDDDPFVLEVVGLSLTSAGFTVLSARGPEDAKRIEADFAGTIHLLLSDVVMHHMYGPDLAQQLLVQRPTMGVILMSGHPDDMHARTYAGHFLQKPFFPHELLGKVNEVLRDGRRRAQTSALRSGGTA